MTPARTLALWAAALLLLTAGAPSALHTWEAGQGARDTRHTLEALLNDPVAAPAALAGAAAQYPPVALAATLRSLTDAAAAAGLTLTAHTATVTTVPGTDLRDVTWILTFTASERAPTRTADLLHILGAAPHPVTVTSLTSTAVTSHVTLITRHVP